jgi:membrane-associated HD superfamily phosphohydrolase
MLNQKYYLFLLSIIFPILLVAQNTELEPVKLIKKDEQTITSTQKETSSNETTEANQTLEVSASDDIDKQLEQQNKLLDEVVQNINSEKYFKISTF